MDEIDLDFLKTPPKQSGGDKRIGSPFVFNEYDVRFAKKKSSKKFELSANIAKVDELVHEIDQLKSRNIELQQQLKGFQDTAQKVQELYIKEKNENSVAKQDLEKLRKEHAKIDENMANMSLVNEQLKARLDEYEGRPISFENLVVKYVKVMTKFQEDDLNKYSQDKDLLERLREYCTVMKYKVPRAISPKKSRSRGNKTQTREAFVQCELIADSSKNPDCTTIKRKTKMQNQSTQCSITKRDQASQYISTMVTRHTNTESIVQKHVQTMFPEPPAIVDILEIFSNWSNIRSVSPLMESPLRSSPPKEILKRLSTTGTCTMLCNIRRKIDYLPSNSSSNIKQEYFTPSASPTPSGTRVNSLSNNATGNINPNPLLSIFNSTTNSSLGQLSFNAFNELWQIFGKMLLSLIQNSNNGIASTNQSAHINQQQFLDWLLELYTNSKAHNVPSEAIHTQILEQCAANDSISPLIFNETSVLSTNILRPQPQKTLPEENVDRRRTKETSNSNLIDCNASERITSTVPSDISLESSVNNEMQQQQITSSSNKIPSTNLQQKEKTKNKIIDKIQELLPEIKLNKNKRKILKGLVKSGCHRKKSNVFKKHKYAQIEDKPSSVVILTNDYVVEDTTETAIDFLKTFAAPEQSTQSIEEDFSETEKIFYKQVSKDTTIKNINNTAPSLASEEPSCSLVQSITAINEPARYSKRIENQYQMLFGDSDDEENESSELKTKPVIKSTIDLESRGSMRDKKACADGVQLEIYDSFNCEHENSKELISTDNTFADNSNTTFQLNCVNMPQEVVIMNEPVFNVDDIEQSTNTEISGRSVNQEWTIALRNATQNSSLIPENSINSIQSIAMPEIQTQILKNIEYRCLPDSIQISDSELISGDNNLQNLNPSLIINNNALENFEKSLSNTLDFPSDVYCVKQNNVIANNANEIRKTETKIEESCLRRELYKSFEKATGQDVTVQTVERTIEGNFNTLPRLTEEKCSNTNLESQPIIINSTAMYTSDFEKDFELSSDNESLNNENCLSRIQEVAAENNEALEDTSCYGNSAYSNTSCVSEAEKTSNLHSFPKALCKSKENCNSLCSKNKANNSVQNNDRLYLSPNKERDQQKISDISSIELSDSRELYNISKSLHKPVLDNNRLSVESLKAECNNMKILDGQQRVAVEDPNAEIISLPKIKYTSEMFASHKKPFNNHNDELITSQKSCLLKSVNDSKSIISNTTIQNGELNSTDNSEEKNAFKSNDTTKAQQTYGSEQTRYKTTENSNKQLLNANSSVISARSQYGIDEAVISSACSVITVTDSTASDDSVKSDQIFKACNQKSHEKDLPKISELRSLRLLHLSKTPQKTCLLNSFSESKSIPKTPIQNGELNSIYNSEEQNVLNSNDNINEQQNYGNEQTRYKTTENSNKQLFNSGNSVISGQLQYGLDATVRSSAWSNITVTDSTASNGSVKSDQIFKAFNKESDKNDLPKISGLRSLRLLHLNNTASQQKSFTNCNPNVKEINPDGLLRNDTNITKESLPSRTTDKETSTTDVNTKMNNAENCGHKSKASASDNGKESENQQETFFTNINSVPNIKVPIQYEELAEGDKSYLSDSLSIEDELMIDEETNETTSKQLQSNPLEISFAETQENCNGTLDSSNISTLLNSSLYNEILTESFKPIVYDLLQEDFPISSATSEAKPKRGRKRKSECLSETQLPCKRSQRLKAKQIILEESLNLSKTQIEFTEYPNRHKNMLNAVSRSSPLKEDIHKNIITTKTECLQRFNMPENADTFQLGFFREIDVEDGRTNNTNKTINAPNMVQLEAEIDKADVICEDNKNLQENPKQTSAKSDPKQNISSSYDKKEEGQIFNSTDDCAGKQPSENFIYTDSPQSPTPIEIQQTNHTSEACVNIPLDRPLRFMPQVNNANLFDTLINSYKNEHQKQVLNSISHKEQKQKEQLLKQFNEQILLHCNDAMELDLYCTSTRLLNKLLSLSPDYDIIQKAVIYVAQNAASANVKENDLPSTIQEMPPRHLSKCLQRLFTFLRIIVTRNSSFCQDLINRIETLLFNPKQIENLSLQATLNLTQLFLMASKIQEYLQIPKHPARLFIAKCLYYYLQKSILMIHEVLLWYPTVLPHREDRTYDRSDALISVIQQILMNTKYDMDKTDLRGKLLISKLRYEYHFEPFKPTQEEVINVLVEKLKNSKFYNISLAFGLLCKRIGVIRTQDIVLGKHLLPLANEYYCLALKTSEYDKRIEILLEIISMLVKAMPIETETKKYFWQFARFLNGFERQTIQEAALCSILRMQRFNVEHCYSLLSHFQPTYNLNAHSQAMLKTFLYRRPLNFWKTLKSKNHINCN